MFNHNEISATVAEIYRIRQRTGLFGEVPKNLRFYPKYYKWLASHNAPDIRSVIKSDVPSSEEAGIIVQSALDKFSFLAYKTNHIVSNVFTSTNPLDAIRKKYCTSYDYDEIIKHFYDFKWDFATFNFLNLLSANDRDAFFTKVAQKTNQYHGDNLKSSISKLFKEDRA